MTDPAPARSPGLSFEALATAVLLVVVFALGCLMPMQNDSWWHLRVGQDIVRLGRVPMADYLSHSATGRFWPNHEWLAQVIFYGAFRAGGLPLLQALAAALVTAAWWLVSSIMPSGARPLYLGLAIPLSAPGWSVRPHLFTMLMLALTLRLLVRGGSRWLLLVLPLWANLHSGVVIVGPLLLLAFLLAVLRGRRDDSLGPVQRGAGLAPNGPTLLLLLVAWALATVATPLGPRLWPFVIENLSSPVARHITEWQPVRLRHPTSVLFVAQSVALLALLVKRWARGVPPGLGPRWDGELLVATALLLVPLALRSTRHIALASLALGPALQMLGNWPGRSSSTGASAGDRQRAGGLILLATAAAALVLIGWAWTRPLARLGWRPLSPPAAAAIAGCPDPLFNRYDDGGFLLWFVPGKAVFVDSRHDPYPHQLMLDQFAVEDAADHRSLFARYRFRCAVLPAGHRLARGLAAEGWRTSFADGRWQVLAGP
jgi:hypothetical protein